MRGGTLRAAALALVGCLAAGCTSGAERPSAEAGQAPVERDYWPTDGWRNAPPADHGFDTAELDEVTRLVDEVYTNARSIVIVRDGYLIYERYWHGVDADDGHDVRSVTKSVVSALVGIALGDGRIVSLDQAVGELLTDHLSDNADPQIRDVTVDQLLSMTSGLPADDPSLRGNESVWEGIVGSPDWVRYILDLPLVSNPGSEFAYSSATSHLLSAIVADTTQQTTLEFARERLFGPLGIRTEDALEPVFQGPPDQASIEQYLDARVAWPRDPQGYHQGGTFLKLPILDLAKFGYLYLNGGAWDGEQIVPAEYVRDSTSAHVSTLDQSADYGWHWWVSTDTEHPAFFARGYGGQLVHVVPDLDLVTVVTSDPESPRGDPEDLVQQAVVRAAAD
jgi:CubicO group peptidase (beta-lactamase class C family)